MEVLKELFYYKLEAVYIMIIIEELLLDFIVIEYRNILGIYIEWINEI